MIYRWIPYTDEKGEITTCGNPQSYNASKEFADKKVVLFSVPGKYCSFFWKNPIQTLFNANSTLLIGAFTPSCSETHLPGYIEKLSQIKAKGVDVVAVIAYNDPFVMSAWGKANSIKGDDIVGGPTIAYRDQRVTDLLAFLDG